MNIRSIINTDGPPSPPNKVRKLSDLPKVHELGPQYVQTQFLDSPSQQSRQSPLDISPRTLSRPRSEATASPYTNFQRTPSLSSPFNQTNMSEAIVSPQAYHRASIPYSTPMPRPPPPEQYHEAAKPEPIPMQNIPVNAVPVRAERRTSSISKPRRQKFKEKPIWAMKISEWNKVRPNSSQPRGPEVKAEPPPATAPAPAPSAVPTVQPQPVRPIQIPTGWEPSINNILPSEEISRTIADFLFQEVVQRKEIPMGPTATGKLEVEAKIGQIVNRDTNDRLRLPILTESILARNDPSVRSVFRSSMTESQHRHFNQYLNEAVKLSLPKKAAPNGPPVTPSNRVRMDYKHTREVDSFYELTPQAESSLPPSIRSLLTHNRGGGPGKARVRITTDQKDSRQLAKIIKVRLADLDVLSPTTPFDWRLSVNLEMNYNEGRENLVEVVESGKRAPDRNKDRMTYLHQCYQIDLTQVTVAGGGADGDKEHELEIEVNVDDLKREGEALLVGEGSKYEDMVRGLVDNVRVLARSARSVL